MADPNQSQTPTQQEYDRDQAGATLPTPAPDDSLEGWTPVEGTQKAAVTPTPAEDKSLEGWTPVEGTAKAVAQPAPAVPQEKPGYLTRLGQSVGVPTTAAELPSFLEHISLPVYSAVKDAPQQVKDYVMKTYNDLHDAIKDQYEAAENVREGGPFWANLAKGTSGILKFGVRQVPIVGEPIYTAGEDVANKNYKGAAGGLTGVVAQLVLPEILHRTSLGGRIESSIKEHANAKTILDGRTGELDVAAKQAQDAEAKAADLRRRQAAGEPVINSGIVQADETASAARANAAKAQKAFDDAQTARNEAAAKVSMLVQRTAEKSRKEQAFHEQVKEQERASKVKAGTLEEVAKSTDDFQKAIPPGTGKAAYTPEDLKNTRPILQKAHAGTPIDSPQGVVDALESDRVSRDSEVRGLVRDNGKYANEPLLLTDDAGNPVSVKQKLVEALSEDEKTRPGFTEAALKELERFNTTDPTLDEADRLRETLNSENRDKLNTPQGKRAISDARETDPEFAARYELQDILRDGIYGRLEEKGVKSARESRRLDASVIRVKNAAERQIRNTDKVVRGSSDVGAFRKGAAKVSTLAGAAAGVTLGVATGLPLAPEVGAVVGGGLGKKVGEYIAPPDVTRGDLLKRSLDVKHPVGEIPRVDVTGAKPSAPPVEPLPPPAEPPVNPRENTELHAALATHYDEQIGDTPYAELEERFLSDIAVKKKYNVPLDPQERKINLEINKSKVEEIQRARGIAEEQKKAAEKAAVDAEKEKKEKEAQGLKTNLASPFETEPHLNPEDERALHHELGHHFQIAKAGHPTQDIIGRQHPQIDAGAQAEARWDPSAFFDENGKLDLGKVRDNIESILDIFHGGAVADEVMNDTPVHKNSGAKTDLRRARTKLIEAGFSPSEAGQLMAASEGRVRKDFTAPGVRDIFQRYSQAREAGLDSGLLMSEETSGRAVQEFKDALEGGREVGNETNNKQKTVGKNGGSNREGKPGGAGRVPPKRPGEGGITAPPRESSGAGEELRANLKDKEAPPITEIIPELKSHPELEQKIKDLGFESVLQKEWMRQQGQKKAPVEYRPSEKAETMSARRTSDLGPEFLQAEHAHEAARLKQIVEDPNASEEEKAIAVQRMKEGTELPAKVLPPERTTGVAEHDAAIKAGGGIPGGVTDLGEFGKIYNYHDPLTGSTLGFKEGKEITPETVKEQIKKSREAFGVRDELKTNLDATPEMEKKIRETPWLESSLVGRELRIKDENGDTIGKLRHDGDFGDESARIRSSYVEPKYRNQGVAKEMYKSAIQDAKNIGLKTFKSDTVVSPDARRVWDSLIRDGKYNIKKYEDGEKVQYVVDLTKESAGEDHDKHARNHEGEQ